MGNKCITCNSEFKSRNLNSNWQKYCSVFCRRKAYRRDVPKGYRNKMAGYVYIIQSVGSNYYKIGQTSRNPLRRIEVLQAGSPVELKIHKIFYVSDMCKIEMYAHGLVAEKRVRGEWFELMSWDLDQVIAFLSEASQNLFVMVEPDGQKLS